MAGEYTMIRKEMRKEWERGWERFFKDAEPFRDVSWKLEVAPTMEFSTQEDYERTLAMIEFCTKYEKESFELFYKWFKKNNGKED
jgi:hypothetical protein